LLEAVLPFTQNSRFTGYAHGRKIGKYRTVSAVGFEYDADELSWEMPIDRPNWVAVDCGPMDATWVGRTPFAFGEENSLTGRPSSTRTRTAGGRW
jgi:hypothetical protein